VQEAGNGECFSVTVPLPRRNIFKGSFGIFSEMAKGSSAQVVGSQGMRESAMSGTWVQYSHSGLFDFSEPLENRSIDDVSTEIFGYGDIPVDRITEFF